MASHSTVTYVEPNMIEQDWQVKDNFERVPRLEDYCIAMNIEVEVSSRDSQGSLKNGNKDVLILQWNNGEKNTVSFMSGTKIGGYTYEGLKRTPNLKGTENNLTTYYADMYVGDLIHYGTTEMIGIKSVNIEYQKSCVPLITVQFTDVRGLSLFQPTELSRDNTYNGIKGLNKDNVAQSFFQCFFKMPLPKFTFYIKGYYGNPVAYVCICDKFDTNFNSDTGDFDVTAHFIGYSYSFMTDISFDALLAAPYSDFFGKQYWEDNKKNGRFFLWDKLKTHKMPMPTLYEVHSDFKKLIQTSNDEMEHTTLTEEEKKHEKELAQLNDIRGKYQLWYQKLFDVLKEKYGKRYCFDFRDSKETDADWYRIIILTNDRTQGESNLSKEYTQFPEEFKEETNNLYTTIENFNSNGNSYKELKNVSKDFSEYTRVKLFNDCYVNSKTRKVEFGGFHPDNRLNRVQVVNRLFHNSNAQYEEEKDRDIYKDYTLSTIYNDGVNQYKDAYLIEVDYTDLKNRINALIADAKKSDDVKERERARKEHNRIMLARMNWYPSIENFTKIMMAHLETFMMMMYNVAESCSDRTPKQLGITIGKNGDACDVPETSEIVPPFPRVVRSEIGEDGITKTVDTWVGEYDNGRGFIEADMINGLFNAVEYIQELVKEETEIEEAQRSGEEVKPKPIIKHPLTSYDFHLTKNIYGTDSDISNNANAFAGKVAMRMFDILSINNFRKQYNTKFNKSNGDFIKLLGTIEAENFYDNVKITNNNMLGLLGAQADSGTINANAILQCVKFNVGIGGNKEIPWETEKNDDTLFDFNLWLSKYTTSYSTTQKSYIYPIQDMSFSSLNDTLKIFNKGAKNIQPDNNDIIVNWIEGDGNVVSLLKSSNKSCFGNAFITDDYKLIERSLDTANSAGDNVYKDIYDMLHEDSVFNKDTFAEMIYSGGVFRPKLGIATLEKGCKYTIGSNIDSLPIHINKNSNRMQCTGGETIHYVFDKEKLSAYTSEVENGNITSWFFTECRGFDNLFGGYVVAHDRSMIMQKDYAKTVESVEGWTYGSTADRRMGFFLMGLEAIDYNAVAKHLNSNETFTYLPKLAVLQMGALLASMKSIKDTISLTSLSKSIFIPNTFSKIIPYLNSINTMTRVAYIRYFKDWVFENVSNISKNLMNTTSQIAGEYEIGNLKRVLFREDSEVMASITNDLMMAVLVTKGNVNHYSDVKKTGLEIDDYTASLYLDAFLARLRQLYGVADEKTGGDAVKLVKDSAKTTQDMKKELYRYLKLVYEKWIPSTDKKSWEFETFFYSDKEAEAIKRGKCDGHLFHFIDSFYNKIGDKLLINPKLLSQKIDAALKANDVNTMMLGFMSGVYSQNKCMLMSLQNFMDFGSEEGGMKIMFKPIAYNEMPLPHKHPDFVVVYPYEPSKYLNVDNGEFNNDSFMLNDEFDTPLAVKSRDMDDKTCYRIPAFGVSYGKQYQSYFKKVSVGMANPIATQQVIQAKHAILRASQDITTKTTAAQDMYDIYASQSYTCTVEMMGCAWIQPLMYFVLNNVPMFRGSYLIFKVNHKITPGNMITSFQGTRMANVSNKLVEDIFTDEDFDAASQPYLENKKYEKADIDNDCPYKEFPLYEEDNTNIEISGDAEKDGLAIMRKLIALGYNPYAAAGIVGNMYVESHDYFKGGTGKHFRYDLVVKDSGTSGGLCMWHNGNLVDLVEGKTKGLGHNKTFLTYSESVRNEYSAKLRKLGLDAQLTYLKNTMTQTDRKENYVPYAFATYNKDAAAAKSASVAAQKFRTNYEKSADTTANQKKVNQKRYDAADKYYKLYKGQEQGTPPPKEVKKSEPKKSPKKDIYQALFQALQKSMDSTGNGCDLKMEKYTSDIMMIKQASGKIDRLPLVFDILLNGYYNYIQKLWWVTATNDFNSNPIHIDVTLSQKPKVEERTVLVMVTQQANKAMELKFGADDSSVNKSLLKALYKKYRGLHKEIPQFTSKEIFKAIEVKNCATCGTPNPKSNTNDKTKPSQKPSENVPNNANLEIDGWSIKKAVDWIINNRLAQFGKGECAAYVEKAIAAGGGPLKTKMSCTENGAPNNHATNLRYYGILEKHGFVQIQASTINPGGNIPTATLQAGDVCIIGHKSHGKYHACMWTGNKWYSDHMQKNMVSSKYPKKDAPYPYAVYRFHNKKGTPIT